MVGEGRRLGLFYAANVLFAAGLFSHAFLYNFYLEGMGHGESVMGGAAASLTAGGLVALVPAGWLVDRLGVRRSYFAACFLACAGLALGAVASSVAGILAAAFVAGSGAATWRVSMGPLLMRVAGPAARSRAFSWNVGLLLAAGSVWTAFSGLLPGWLESAQGVSGPEAVRAVLLVGAAATLAGALPLALRGGLSPGMVRAVASGMTRISGGERFGLERGTALFVGMVAVWMMAGGLVLPFFNVFFLREHGMAVGGIGVLFGVAQGLAALALLAGGWLAGRAGAYRMVLAWAVPFAPLLWGLGLVSATPAAVVLFTLQGFVPPATNPLIDQILLEQTPANRHGVVSMWRNAATEGSGLVGAAVGGVLLEATSFGTLFGVAGCVAVLGLLGLARALGRLSPSGAVAVAPAVS